MTPRLLNHLRLHGTQFTVRHDKVAQLFTARLELRQGKPHPPRVVVRERPFRDTDDLAALLDELATGMEAALEAGENASHGMSFMSRMGQEWKT